jgi:cytochrome c oxidase subunit IV
MNQSKDIKLIDSLWLLLISLTLFSAYMAERADPGFISVAIMAAVLAIKGRIIVDHFMELKHAHKLLRNLMRAYFYVIPSLILIVYLFPEQIAKWTTLS